MEGSCPCRVFFGFGLCAAAGYQPHPAPRRWSGQSAERRVSGCARRGPGRHHREAETVELQQVVGQHSLERLAIAKTYSNPEAFHLRPGSCERAHFLLGVRRYRSPALLKTPRDFFKRYSQDHPLALSNSTPAGAQYVCGLTKPARVSRSNRDISTFLLVDGPTLSQTFQTILRILYHWHVRDAGPLTARVQAFLDFCRIEKGLSTATIDSYSFDLARLIQFIQVRSDEPGASSIPGAPDLQA